MGQLSTANWHNHEDAATGFCCCDSDHFGVHPIDADPSQYGAKAARAHQLMQMGGLATLAVRIESHQNHSQVPIQALQAAIASWMDHSNIPFTHKICLRSSALDEDQHSGSNAGQYDSEFGLCAGAPDFASRLGAYLRLMSQKCQTRQALTFFVQPEIRFDISGILFSAHPDQALRGHSYIEYSTHHGVRLTEGRAAASFVLVSKWSHKQIAHQCASNHRLDARSIDQLMHIKDQIATSAATGNDSDGKASHVDIEFGIIGHRTIPLQFRPISAFNPPVYHGLWSREAADEFWSGEVSALMWDTVGDAIENFMIRQPLSTIVSRDWLRPLMRQFNRQIYVGTDAIASVLKRLPGWAAVGPLRSLVTPDLSDYPYRLAPLLPASTLRMLASFLRAGFDWLPWQAMKNMPQLRSSAHRTWNNAQTITHQTDASTAQLEQAIRTTMASLEYHLSKIVWGMAWTMILSQLTRGVLQLFAAKQPQRIDRALAGNPHDPALHLQAALQSLAKAEHNGNHTAVDEFFQQYGHLTFGRDLSHRRWHESRESVLNWAANLGSNSIVFQTDVRASMSLVRSLPVGMSVLACLLFPVVYFNVAIYRRMIGWRESMRVTSDCYTASLRQLWIRYEKATCLPQSIFDCTLGLGLVPSQLDPTAAGATAPKWLSGDEPLRTAHRPAEQASDRIQGLGVSTGIAEGTIVRVQSLDDLCGLTRQDIICSEYMDPSLAPALQQVSGGIFVYGGSLSHAAILAREYNVPAICNIESLDKLSTGTRVRICGTTGAIDIL